MELAQADAVRLFLPASRLADNDDVYAQCGIGQIAQYVINQRVRHLKTVGDKLTHTNPQYVTAQPTTQNAITNSHAPMNLAHA
ncbi:MAG: hypothetical protein ACEQSD_08760, partial [Flavobacteriales bacterium]